MKQHVIIKHGSLDTFGNRSKQKPVEHTTDADDLNGALVFAAFQLGQYAVQEDTIQYECVKPDHHQLFLYSANDILIAHATVVLK